MKNMDMTTGFETIDLDSLQRVNGGDSWGDYKKQVKQNVTETLGHAKDAAVGYGKTVQAASQGQFGQAATELGNAVDHHGGYIYGIGKTLTDAIKPIKFW